MVTRWTCLTQLHLLLLLITQHLLLITQHLLLITLLQHPTILLHHLITQLQYLTAQPKLLTLPPLSQPTTCPLPLLTAPHLPLTTLCQNINIQSTIPR